MDGMRRLQAEGVIRDVGVSNYSLSRWKAADRALGSPVISNQVRYNLIDRRPENEILPWARANGRIIVAYSPLAQGLLSGRYDVDRRPSDMVRANSPGFLPENFQRLRPLVEELKAVAKAHNASPSQVSLAWLIRSPNVVVIPGASSVAQLESNVAAADLQLSDDEYLALRDASAAFRPIKGPGVVAKIAGGMIGRIISR